MDPFDPLPLNVFGADNQGGNGDDNNDNNNDPGGGEEGRNSKKPSKRVQAWKKQKMDKEIFNTGMLCSSGTAKGQ